MARERDCSLLKPDMERCVRRLVHEEGGGQEEDRASVNARSKEREKNREKYIYIYIYMNVAINGFLLARGRSSVYHSM